MKQTLTPLMIFGIVWLAVVAFSWFFFEGWRNSPGGIWTLLGLSAVGVLAVLKGGLDYLSAYKGLTKPDAPKSDPTHSIRIEQPTGNMQANTGDGSTQRQAGGNYYERVDKIEIHEAPKPERETHDTLGLRPPHRMNHYVPRGDIEDKVIACLKAGGTGAIVGINAPGGLGKTELAKRVSSLLEDEFKNNYLWVDAGEANLERVLDSLILKMNIQLPPNPTFETKVNEAQHVLLFRGRTMIVFDDLRSSASDFFSYFKAPKNCSVLITSRIQDLPHVQEVFLLHRMTPAQSHELFVAILGRDVVERESREVYELAERCKYNSLLMDNAARRIRQETDAPYPVRDYLAKANRFGVVSMGGEKVLPVFDISYNDLNPEDQKRLRYLATFHSTGFSSEAAAHLWDMEEQDVYGVIDRFINLSLIKRTPDESPRYRLHDLWDEYAGNLLEKSGEEATARSLLAEWLVELFEDHSLHDLSNARQVFYELENLRSSARWAAQNEKGEMLALLATKPRNWLYNIFRINNEWLEWLIASLNYRVDSLESKANVLQAIGDIQQFRDDRNTALQSYEQALKLFREIGAKLGEANTYLSLGGIKWTEKDVAEARKEYESALSLYQLIGDQYSQGRALYRIGDVDMDEEKYKDALSHYEHARSLWSAN